MKRTLSAALSLLLAVTFAEPLVQQVFQSNVNNQMSIIATVAGLGPTPSS